MDWFRRFLAPPQRSAPEVREIASFFNEAAADEEHYPSSIDPRIYHVKLVREHLGDISHKRVADIGCGKGRFARILKEQHPTSKLVALDLATAMLQAAPADLLRCTASMTALPLASETFDAGYATESLEHAVDIETAIAELCRIVKPGGRIVIIDKNAQHWGKLETPTWEKWFTRKQLERLLRRHCREVSSRYISYWEDVAPDGLFIAWLATK